MSSPFAEPAAPVRTLRNYIGGRWVDSAAERREAVPNPATGEALAVVPFSTRAELDEAVEAAAQAFPSWSRTPVPRRARVLFHCQQLLTEHRDELARIVTLENGKSLTEAHGEVQRGIECVEFAAGAPTLMMGSQLPDIATGIESGMYRYPLGVVGGITPFNFPMMVPCWMFPLAVACGNTFVLKPSERTPLLACRLAELFAEAGLPPGVLNIVHGAHGVVNGLLENERVKAISFVGSQPAAEYVYKTAAANGKRVQALAGAKNHSIVMPDADLELAVTNITAAAFGSAGERCMAAAVVVAVGGIADELVARLVQAADAIRIGNGLEEGVFLGPVIREENKARTIRYIEIGVAEGAELVRDGRRDAAAVAAGSSGDAAAAVAAGSSGDASAAVAAGSTGDASAAAIGSNGADGDAPATSVADGAGRGYFVGPTIFDRVKPGMTIWRDEIFAPVLSVVRAESLTEAIAIANRSPFANGACLYTDSAQAVRQFRDEIEAGMLGVNVGVPAPMAFFPFSGYKNSFYGDLHANGKDGVEFYTRKKMLTARY